MFRHVAAAALLLTLSACSKNQQGLQTIEDAEAFAKARGVTLAEKKENTESMVSNRAYTYKANGVVGFALSQFNTEEAASEWKRMSDDSPFSQESRLLRGRIVMTVWGATDSDRQKIITALQDE